MAIELHLESPRLRQPELDSLTSDLNRALNRERDLVSQKKLAPAGKGARAVEVFAGTLLIELLQSGAITAFIGVLKAYIARERSLSLKLTAPDGQMIEINATNFRENNVMEMLRNLVPGYDAPSSTPEAAAHDPPAPEEKETTEPPPRRPVVVPMSTAPAAPTSTDGARKIAIVIGQERFPEDPELEPLRFARDDATALHNLLLGETGERFDTVELITEVTHYDALSRIEQIVAGTREDDLLMVYYAGHGLVRNQKLHLAFANTKSDFVHSTAMKYGNLLDIVEQAQARRRMVVLDCCYAGAAGEMASRSAVREQVEMELGNTRTLVFTSTTSTQVARETEELGHGVFTKHLLDGLKGAADRNGDGSVDSEELFRYVRTRMEQDHMQRPQKFNYSGSSPIKLRQTGLHPHRDATRAMLRQVNELYHDGMIPLRYVQAFQKVLNLSLEEMRLEEEKQFRLLERSLKGPFKPGPLIDDWDKLDRQKSPAPKRTSPDPAPRPAREPDAPPETKARAKPAAPAKEDHPVKTPKPPRPPPVSRIGWVLRKIGKVLVLFALLLGVALFVSALGL